MTDLDLARQFEIHRMEISRKLSSSQNNLQLRVLSLLDAIYKLVTCALRGGDPTIYFSEVRHNVTLLENSMKAKQHADSLAD
jgi:hypothetical protein